MIKDAQSIAVVAAGKGEHNAVCQLLNGFKSLVAGALRGVLCAIDTLRPLNSPAFYFM